MIKIRAPSDVKFVLLDDIYFENEAATTKLGHGNSRFLIFFLVRPF
jgi:hypothetical protein